MAYSIWVWGMGYGVCGGIGIEHRAYCIWHMGEKPMRVPVRRGQCPSSAGCKTKNSKKTFTDYGHK